MKTRQITLIFMFISLAACVWAQQVFGADKARVAVISETEICFKLNQFRNYGYFADLFQNQEFIQQKSAFVKQCSP